MLNKFLKNIRLKGSKITILPERPDASVRHWALKLVSNSIKEEYSLRALERRVLTEILWRGRQAQENGKKYLTRNSVICI
jgi:hypothetical protein